MALRITFLGKKNAWIGMLVLVQAATLRAGDGPLNKGVLSEPAIVAIPEKKAWKPGDPITFLDGKMTVDLQERLRLEMRNNTFDFNDSLNGPQDDTFLLQRVRLGLMYQPLEWMRFYAQGQDTREFFSGDRTDTPFVGGSEGDNTFNLRQACGEFGDFRQFPVLAKLGRQELNYGDERLIGAFDWNNFSRTFDGGKFSWQATPKMTVDFFAASVVIMEGYEPLDGDQAWEFNDSNWSQDQFAGAYATDKGGLADFQQTEAYFLYRNKDTNDPNYRINAASPDNFAYDVNQENYTIGFRLKSIDPKKLLGFDYEADFACQFGMGGLPPTGAGGRGLQTGLPESAFAGHVAGGYRFDSVAWKPRVGLDYALATGDENPFDNRSESFMNLFPTNHKFYGYMDLFAWKNMHDLSCNAQAKPCEKITLRFDHHFFWLFTNEDAWYRANAVTAVRPLNAAARNADTFVGHEIDLTATYACSKWMNILVGYSHFFSGAYVRDTSADGARDDADYFYLQTSLKF